MARKTLGKDMLHTLFIMRHAKSSWADSSQTDHQRPLNDRGRRAATRIGQTLSARGHKLDMIWASDAARTTETAKHIIRAVPGAQMIRYFSELYHASPQNLFTVCENEKEPDGGLMWLGHNPGWAELYAMFTGRHMDFPTGACGVFSRRPSGGAWYAPESWRPVDLLLPRDLE